MRQTAAVQGDEPTKPEPGGRLVLDRLRRQTRRARAEEAPLPEASARPMTLPDPSVEGAGSVRKHGALRPRLALGGVVLCVLSVHVVWLLLDRTPLAFVDSYAYLSRLLYTMHALSEVDRLGDLLHAFDRLSLNGRPPLYQLLASPVLWLLGTTEDAAIVVNLAFLALGALAIQGLASQAGSRWAGALAAALYLTYPPVVAVNHEFLPHAVVPTLIVTTLWNLVWLVQASSSLGSPSGVDPSDVVSSGSGKGRARRVDAAVAWLDGRLPGGGLTRPELAGWLLLGQITFGALMHPSYLGMVVVPVAVALTSRIAPGLAAVLSTRTRHAGAERGSNRSAWLAARSLRRVWLPGGLLSGGAICLWYLGPGSVIIDKYRGFKGQALVAFRRQQYLADGFRDQAGPGWYLETASAALSTPLVVLGVLGVAWALIRLVFGRRSQHRGRGIGARALIVVALAWTVTVIQLGETAFAWWKMAPALPMLALLSALAVMDLPGRVVRRATVVAVCAVCVFNLAFVLFGSKEIWMGSMARGLGARLDSDTCTRTARHACVYCPQPPREEQWPSKAFVDTIRTQTETVTDDDPGNNEIMIVGGPMIRPALFSFWMAKHWPENGYRVRGTGYKNWGYPYNLRALLETRFILFAPQPVRKRAKAYVPITLRLLMSPPPSFARSHDQIAVFPLRVDPIYRSVKELRLLRRVEELTVAEAEAVIERLDLAPKYVPQAPVLLEEIRTGDRVHRRGRRQ